MKFIGLKLDDLLLQVSLRRLPTIIDLTDHSGRLRRKRLGRSVQSHTKEVYLGISLYLKSIAICIQFADFMVHPIDPTSSAPCTVLRSPQRIPSGLITFAELDLKYNNLD